jgi:hypothetical protein
MASVREHVGVGGSNNGSVFSTKKESKEGGKNESSSRVRGILRASWTNQWGHGQGMATTVCPHGGNSLRPVGHNRLKRLNSTESRVPVTD